LERNPTQQIGRGIGALSRRGRFWRIVGWRVALIDGICAMPKTPSVWPDIPYPEWRETCAALHLWAQIVGKFRFANTPWENHSWHATFYVVPRGLSTGPIYIGPMALALDFDFIDQQLRIEASNGKAASFALESMSVATFLERVGACVEAVGARFAIDGMPNEIAGAVCFNQDVAVRPYDVDAVRRFHGALLQIDRVLKQFRTSFLGKASPVHLFWGSFDLAVTRFSGRRAPLHPGGIPNLPDAVTREAYSHQESSAGFWAGEGVGEPMFYSYAYPATTEFGTSPVTPSEAYWDAKLGEFLLPYRIVRASPDPDATLLQFLQSTYEAAAVTGAWDRRDLEFAPGVARVPRSVTAP